MSKFFHRKLPDFSTILSGRSPRDEFGFQSDRLQIWYNNTNTSWRDDKPHAHQESDECFIVLKGRLEIEVEGQQHFIGAGEYCCFPKGLIHQIISVETPVESLMIRAPSVGDKVYSESLLEI